MNDAEKNAVLTDLHDRLLAAGALPPWVLPMIQAILNILQSGVCGGPIKARDAAKENTVLARLRFRKELADEGIPFGSIHEAVNIAIKVCGAASDEDANKLAACAE